jgi:hypothetical protein
MHTHAHTPYSYCIHPRSSKMTWKAAICKQVLRQSVRYLNVRVRERNPRVEMHPFAAGYPSLGSARRHFSGVKFPTHPRQPTRHRPLRSLPPHHTSQHCSNLAEDYRRETASRRARCNPRVKLEAMQPRWIHSTTLILPSPGARCPLWLAYRVLWL